MPKHNTEIEIALLPCNVAQFEAEAAKISASFEIKFNYTNDGARNYLVSSDNIVDFLAISSLIHKYEKLQFNS